MKNIGAETANYIQRSSCPLTICVKFIPKNEAVNDSGTKMKARRVSLATLAA